MSRGLRPPRTAQRRSGPCSARARELVAGAARLGAIAIAVVLAGPAGLLGLDGQARAAGRSGGAKVQEVCKTLTEHANFKVRVQAALVLGKIHDTSASPCLTKAFADPNPSVRAMAAQALGQLGDVANAEALQMLATRDSDAFVRAQAMKALDAVSRPGAGGPPGSGAAGGPGGRAKIFLNFGPFTGGVKAAAGDGVRIVHDTLQNELGKLPIVSLTAIPGAKPGSPSFWIDGNINRLDDVGGGASVEVACGVKVMVAAWPSKKIISWTSAEASVQSGSRQRDRDNAHRECLEATANQLAEDLAKFLKAQGG